MLLREGLYTLTSSPISFTPKRWLRNKSLVGMMMSKEGKTMPTLNYAIDRAFAAHRLRVDDESTAYMSHLLRVMHKVEGEIEKVVAVLHHVVKDEKCGNEDPAKMGYTTEVLAALDCLTKRDCESYEELVLRTATNPVARRVMIADLEDKMDISSLPSLTDEDCDSLKRDLATWRNLKGFEQCRLLSKHDLVADDITSGLERMGTVSCDENDWFNEIWFLRCRECGQVYVGCSQVIEYRDDNKLHTWLFLAPVSAQEADILRNHTGTVWFFIDSRRHITFNPDGTMYWSDVPDMILAHEFNPITGNRELSLGIPWLPLPDSPA